MHYSRATIQYDGTDYSGFQWQVDAPTIQDELNQAIAKLTQGKVTVAGASRTDSGVHAVDQVIRITSENPLEGESFITILNKTLPPQIHCLNLVPCTVDFNPNVHSISKEYRYLFTNTTRVATEDRRFISNISNRLNAEAMQECVSMIRGEHDFTNFCSTGSNVKTTIRNVLICELTEVDPRLIFQNTTLFQIPADLTNCFQLRIEASGFLKQMIRHIVSGLWMVGSGRLTVHQFQEILEGPKLPKQIWKVAPARGLYLYKIKYPPPST